MGNILSQRCDITATLYPTVPVLDLNLNSLQLLILSNDNNVRPKRTEKETVVSHCRISLMSVTGMLTVSND